MTRLFQILFALFVLTSCSERFDSIDPTAFNKKIANRIDIETAQELIAIFYHYSKNEEISNLSFYKKKMDKGLTEIILIHDGQKDDSQRAIKIIMIVELKNKKWLVKEIKNNRKCWKGRGHTNWDTAWCN